MLLRRGAFLPNLVTVGNGVCGFAALVNCLKIQIVTDPTTGARMFSRPELFSWAAWLILIGMIFDVFDGKLARLSGRTSDLGAQMDSLCDLTTFGLAPAILVVRLNMIYDLMWGKAVWFFALAYFLGALLRLARFNAENDHADEHHLCFKGLPSPGAAGCVASLVIFYRYIEDFKDHELRWIGKLIEPGTIQAAFSWIPFAAAVLLLVLGYTMVSSRLQYVHVASRIFNRRHSFEFFVSIVFGTILAALFPEVVLPSLFIGYLAYTPAVAAFRKLTGKPAPAAPGSARPAEDLVPEPPFDRRSD
jgi:CDP-diacylglycerol--serine O-phosphatidyltransferase